jgi:hypothetical protein
MSSTNSNSKKSRDPAFPRLGGVDYTAVSNKPFEDKRFLREKQVSTGAPSGSISSTFDAFQRMAAGLEGRKISDKIADPNRPTWDQYKKENEDKLDMVGTDVRKMVEYRAELDRERDRKLRRVTASSGTTDKSDDKEHRKRKKSHKKHSRRHSSNSDSSSSSSDTSDDSSSDDDSSDDDDNSDKRRKRHKDDKKKHDKKQKKHKHKKDKDSKKSSKKHKRSSRDDSGSDSDDHQVKTGEPWRLSDFMRNGVDDSDN